MYCGSCLRDNALASELIAQGHDVMLLPLYTPTRTDEPNVSQRRVFFGGISIYLEQKSRIFGWTPKFLDRLWDHPAVIRFFSGRGVQVDPAALGALTVSVLEGRDGRQRKEVDHLAEWLRHEAPPDAITLPFTLLIGLAGPLKEAARRPVVCTLQGEELFLNGLREPWRTQALELIQRKVRDVDAFIAVSRASAAAMSAYLKIPREKIHVVPLGISLDGYSPRPGHVAGPRRIGFLGRIAPEKGLHVLGEAFRILRERPGVGPLRLEAAGWMGPEHRAYLEGVAGKMPAGEFEYYGELSRERKAGFLRSLDVFSLPCTYDEPKGLPVLEAMACGVPVVQPRRGSFPEIIDATGGGLLVEPDSAESLAGGLHRILMDPALASRLSGAGHQAVHSRFGIAQMAQRTLEVYRNAGQGSADQHLAGRSA